MKQLLLFLSLSIFFSCQKNNKTSYNSKKDVLEINPGKKLLETQCYICHSPVLKHDDRVAPPMIAIKKHYINDDVSKEEFIKSMQNWIKNPTKENAKMFGAVRRFGLMPKQAYPEETIKQIADYLYDNEIEKPEWFDEHHNKEKGKGRGKGMKNVNANFKNLSFGERGLKYALSTKKVLGKNLMGKIQKEGTIAALEFCNMKAYPLTDSMSVIQKATIKRVSDKPRNSKNTASNIEKGYIEIFKKDIISKKESEPIVVESGNNVNVYYPIKTNSMCLQCHGKPNSNIKSNTLNKIKNLYPNDLATGYSENEIRGIWSITFSK